MADHQQTPTMTAGENQSQPQTASPLHSKGATTRSQTQLQQKTAYFTLIVNVPPTTTRNDLAQAFRRFGPIELTMVVCSAKYRHPTREWTATAGYGFVRFVAAGDARAALAAATAGEVRVRGSRVRATWAKKDSYDCRFEGSNEHEGRRHQKPPTAEVPAEAHSRPTTHSVPPTQQPGGTSASYKAAVTPSSATSAATNLSGAHPRLGGVPQRARSPVLQQHPFYPLGDASTTAATEGLRGVPLVSMATAGTPPAAGTATAAGPFCYRTLFVNGHHPPFYAGEAVVVQMGPPYTFGGASGQRTTCRVIEEVKKEAIDEEEDCVSRDDESEGATRALTELLRTTTCIQCREFFGLTVTRFSCGCIVCDKCSAALPPALPPAQPPPALPPAQPPPPAAATAASPPSSEPKELVVCPCCGTTSSNAGVSLSTGDAVGETLFKILHRFVERSRQEVKEPQITAPASSSSTAVVGDPSTTNAHATPTAAETFATTPFRRNKGFSAPLRLQTTRSC